METLIRPPVTSTARFVAAAPNRLRSRLPSLGAWRVPCVRVGVQPQRLAQLAFHGSPAAGVHEQCLGQDRVQERIGEWEVSGTSAPASSRSNR
jgi:hypothetical protein